MSEKCAIGGQNLDLQGSEARTGGNSNPPRPAPLPGTAPGDSLLLRTDVPAAKTALRSASAARATGTLPRVPF